MIDLLHCEYCLWLATRIITNKPVRNCHKDPEKHPVKNYETEYCNQYEENYPAKQIKRWAAEHKALEAKENKREVQLNFTDYLATLEAEKTPAIA